MMMNVGKTLPFLPPTGHGHLGKTIPPICKKMVMTGGCFFWVHIGLPLFGGWLPFFFHIFTLVSGWGPSVTPFVDPTETISFTSRCSDPGFQVR